MTLPAAAATLAARQPAAAVARHWLVLVGWLVGYNEQAASQLKAASDSGSRSQRGDGSRAPHSQELSVLHF